MSTTNFLVIKHYPDPVRREGRNIGVVLFHEGTTHLRAIGQLVDGVRIGGRRAPTDIKPAYFDQMLHYWQALLEEDADIDYWLSRNRPDSHVEYELGGGTLGTPPEPQELLEVLMNRLVLPPKQTQ